MPLEFDVSAEASLIAEKTAQREKLLADEADLLNRLADVRARLDEVEGVINQNVKAIREKK